MKYELIPLLLRSQIRQRAAKNWTRLYPCLGRTRQAPPGRRFAHSPADNRLFNSIVDNPPQLVKTGQRHGPGLVVLSRSPTP